MPKAVQYSANSVIYFSGDFDARVFLLHSGHIALNSLDIETGAQVTEYIKTGEFFGVKSALGNYPREESAMRLCIHSLLPNLKVLLRQIHVLSFKC